MKKSANFKLDEAGVFIALTSMSFGEEKEFYPALKGIVTKYKERCREANEKLGFKVKDKFFEKYCYEPMGYCLWGSFDLAMISLVDDFSLSSRTFRPYSDLFTSATDASKNFNYQVMTTAHSYPVAKNGSANFGCKGLISLWDAITCQGTENKFTNRFNYIGICSFKINNGLILGTGSNTIDLIKLKLAAQINATIRKDGHFIILDSFSCYEIVILFFSDDVDKIARCLAECREITIKDLFTYGDKFVKEINGQDFKTLKEIIKKKSFLSKNAYSQNQDDLVNSHVFVNTYSHLGFNIDLILDTTINITAIAKSSLRLIPKYTIKPGHYKEAESLLKSTTSNESEAEFEANFNFLFGENDAFVNVIDNLEQSKSFSFKEHIQHIRNNISVENKANFRKHLRRMKTLPYFKSLMVVGSTFDPQKHTIPFLHKFAYSQAKIDEVREFLDKLRASKVVSERVLRMYVSFNSGILDPVMYIYFIDLKPLLDNLITILKKYCKNIVKSEISAREVHDTLLEIAQIFEHANANRFHQSYQLNEITNTNLDFNGGIQQIVSAMDTVYKFVHSALNRHMLGKITQNDYDCSLTFPCVYVAAHPGVHANEYSLRLNYFHVFEPAIYMAQIVKEAANFIPVRSDNLFPDKTLSNDLDVMLTEIIQRFRYRDLSIYLPHVITKEEEMHEYWIVDVIVFCVGYFLNIDLFTFWFWHIPLQTASAYTSDGYFDEDDFCKLLIRYLMVVQYTGNFITGKKKILAPSVKLQNLWNKHFDKCFAFVKEVQTLSSVEAFYHSRLPDIIDPILKNTNSPNIDFNNWKWSDKERKKASTYIDKYTASHSDNKINHLAKTEDLNHFAQFLKYRISKDPEYMGNTFKTFNEEVFFIFSMFNAHITKVADVFASYSYEYSLLDRDFENTQSGFIYRIAEHIKRPQPLKFDELGGFFTAGYNDKRYLFKNKIASIKAMIDFSLKNKPRLLE